MGVIVAFFVGYVLGARAGREGLEELLDSLDTISQSNELRGLVATGLSMVDTLVRGALVPGRAEAGNGSAGAALGDWARETLVRNVGSRAS